MWREPPGLRKLAGDGLDADDERQLHDLCFCEMFPYLSQARFGDLEVVRVIFSARWLVLAGSLVRPRWQWTTSR